MTVVGGCSYWHRSWYLSAAAELGGSIPQLFPSSNRAGAGDDHAHHLRKLVNQLGVAFRRQVHGGSAHGEYQAGDGLGHQGGLVQGGESMAFSLMASWQECNPDFIRCTHPTRVQAYTTPEHLCSRLPTMTIWAILLYTPVKIWSLVSKIA